MRNAPTLQLIGATDRVASLDSGDAEVVIAIGGDEVLSRLLPSPVPLVLLSDSQPQAGWFSEGVRAILPHSISSAELAAAVVAAAHGLVVFHPSELPSLEPVGGSAIGVGAPDDTGVGEPLTIRETEVLRLLADGDGNKIIAYKLGISEHTVKFHVSQIMSKLGAGSRTEAAAVGIRRGLVPL